MNFDIPTHQEQRKLRKYLPICNYNRCNEKANSEILDSFGYPYCCVEHRDFIELWYKENQARNKN